MPTVSVVTNVDVAKADAVKLVGALTNAIYPVVGCPAGHVHVHVLAGQPVSFGEGDCVTPCCHMRIVMAGDCTRSGAHMRVSLLAHFKLACFSHTFAYLRLYVLSWH
jgi:hypothetical protein